jgi:hypothetical protein
MRPSGVEVVFDKAGRSVLPGQVGRSAKICMELSLLIAVPFRKLDLNQTVQFDVDLHA